MIVNNILTFLLLIPIFGIITVLSAHKKLQSDNYKIIGLWCSGFSVLLSILLLGISRYANVTASLDIFKFCTSAFCATEFSIFLFIIFSFFSGMSVLITYKNKTINSRQFVVLNLSLQLFILLELLACNIFVFFICFSCCIIVLFLLIAIFSKNNTLFHRKFLIQYMIAAILILCVSVYIEKTVGTSDCYTIAKYVFSVNQAACLFTAILLAICLIIPLYPIFKWQYQMYKSMDISVLCLIQSAIIFTCVYITAQIALPIISYHTQLFSKYIAFFFMLLLVFLLIKVIFHHIDTMHKKMYLYYNFTIIVALLSFFFNPDEEKINGLLILINYMLCSLSLAFINMILYPTNKTPHINTKSHSPDIMVFILITIPIISIVGIPMTLGLISNLFALKTALTINYFLTITTFVFLIIFSIYAMKLHCNIFYAPHDCVIKYEFSTLERCILTVLCIVIVLIGMFSKTISCVHINYITTAKIVSI